MFVEPAQENAGERIEVGQWVIVPHPIRSRNLYFSPSLFCSHCRSLTGEAGSSLSIPHTLSKLHSLLSFSDTRRTPRWRSQRSRGTRRLRNVTVPGFYVTGWFRDVTI